MEGAGVGSLGAVDSPWEAEGAENPSEDGNPVALEAAADGNHVVAADGNHVAVVAASPAVVAYSEAMRAPRIDAENWA